MLAQPQRDLVEHGKIGPRLLEADQPGHHPVEIADQIVGAVARGAVAGLPQIHEQRIVAIGLALGLAVGLGLLGLAHRLGGDGFHFAGLGPLGGKDRVAGDGFAEATRKGFQFPLVLLEHRQGRGPLGGEAGEGGIAFGHRLLGRAQILGMGLEQVARLRLGARNGAIELALDRRIEAQMGELAEQLGLAFLDLGDALGRTRQPAGDILFLAANVAHRLVEAGQSLGAADAHSFTIALRRRRGRAHYIQHRGSHRTCDPPHWPG